MRELPVNLQLNGDESLYSQIYKGVRDEIRGGAMLPGEKLPSARNLASCLQVSRTTVDEAYAQLVSEGYVEAKAKRGYFVCDLDGIYTIGSDMHDSANPAAIYAHKEKAIPSEWLYDFSPMKTDMSEFPYATWKRIMRGIMVDARSSMFMMGDPKGDIELRSTISRYLHGSRGVVCKPEQIVIGAGNDYLQMMLAKILGSGRKVAMENPSYQRACRMFMSLGCAVVPVDTDMNGMMPDVLRASGADIAYLMPAHQFPMGIVMPASRRAEMLKWSQERDDRYIVEDDYDSEFRYRGNPVPSLQGLDRYGKVIYIGTFSKSIAPAIRISYMVLPEELLSVYEEKCGFYTSTVSRIDQAILNEFISAGYFERYLNKMRKRYKQKHDEMISGLREFGNDFELSGENAGLHMVITDRRGRTEDELIRSAASAGIKVYGNMENYIAAPPVLTPARILLGYAPLSMDDIADGLKILCRTWM